MTRVFDEAKFESTYNSARKLLANSNFKKQQELFDHKGLLSQMLQAIEKKLEFTKKLAASRFEYKPADKLSDLANLEQLQEFLIEKKHSITREPVFFDRIRDNMLSVKSSIFGIRPSPQAVQDHLMLLQGDVEIDQRTKPRPMQDTPESQLQPIQAKAKKFVEVLEQKRLEAQNKSIGR